MSFVRNIVGKSFLISESDKIAERYKMRIYELQILADHVHLFAEIPPTMSVAKAKQLFKGISARELRRLHPDKIHEYKLREHFWSNGSFHRSVANVTAETIQHCIVTSQNNFVASPMF